MHDCKKDFLAHVHEVEGHVCLAGRHPHTHCLDATTSRGIPCGKSHVHEVEFKTTIDDCHCHKFCGRTGPAIQAGDGDHIHILDSFTSCNDGHKHHFKIATSTEILVRC